MHSSRAPHGHEYMHSVNIHIHARHDMLRYGNSGSHKKRRTLVSLVQEQQGPDDWQCANCRTLVAHDADMNDPMTPRFCAAQYHIIILVFICFIQAQQLYFHILTSQEDMIIENLQDQHRVLHDFMYMKQNYVLSADWPSSTRQQEQSHGFTIESSMA